LIDIEIKNAIWSHESKADGLLEIDIGIIPLREGDWSKGKCALKTLQFMSMGIPFVASPVGMNREVIQPGVNGFLAKTEEK